MKHKIRDDEFKNEGKLKHVKNDKMLTNLSTCSNPTAGPSSSTRAGVMKIVGRDGDDYSGPTTPSTSRRLLGNGGGGDVYGEVGRSKADT